MMNRKRIVQNLLESCCYLSDLRKLMSNIISLEFGRCFRCGSIAGGALLEVDPIAIAIEVRA